MKCLIILSAILATTVARPGVLLSPQVAPIVAPIAAPLISPLAITRLVPGAPIGIDGRVVDTPEVAYAKAEHAAAHINERITLANEAVRSAEPLIAYSATAPVIASNLQPIVAARIVPAAPIGLDGRVVDTPEVALAKAEHAAAHINEKIERAALSTYTAPVVQNVLL